MFRIHLHNMDVKIIIQNFHSKVIVNISTEVDKFFKLITKNKNVFTRK